MSRPLKQKTIGILGGASNVATAEYYRLINAYSNAHLGGWDIAETLIAGMNFGNIEAFIRAEDWAALAAYVAPRVDALIGGGADIIVCVSNTLHKVVEPLAAARGAAFLHIADPTGAAMQAREVRRAILFGTQPVMRLDHLQQRYKRKHGVEILTPTEAEQVEIDRIIFNELVKDVVRQESKARFLDICDRLVAEAGAEGLILGCTEIFLLVDQSDRPSLPIFNTTSLHCEAAVSLALGS